MATDASGAYFKWTENVLRRTEAVTHLSQYMENPFLWVGVELGLSKAVVLKKELARRESRVGGAEHRC